MVFFYKLGGAVGFKERLGPVVFYELVKIIAKEWPHVKGYFAFGVNKHGGGLGEYIKAFPYRAVKVGQVDEVG